MQASSPFQRDDRQWGSVVVGGCSAATCYDEEHPLALSPAHRTPCLPNLVAVWIGAELLEDSAVRGVALLTSSGTPLAISGELDDDGVAAPVDWSGFADAASAVLRHDPEVSAEPLAAHTEGMQLGTLRFSVLRSGPADIDAMGTPENEFALKVAALPWRLLIVALADKQDARQLRAVTENLASRLRA